MTGSPEALIGPNVEAETGFVRLARSSVVFVLGAVAGKAVGLVLLPILTRTLSPEGLGETDVLLSMGSALTAALTLGLDVAVLRLWFDRPDGSARRRLIGSAYVIASGAAVVAGGLVFAAAGAIAGGLFSGSNLELAVRLMPVVLVAGVLITINQTVLRAQDRAGWFAVVNGGVVLLYAALAVALLTHWRADGNAVLLAWSVALAVIALLSTLAVRGVALGRPSMLDGRDLLRLGLPLAPAVTATLIGDFLNRTVLLAAAGPAEVAYFTVAARFAAVAGLAVGGFQLAWHPRAYAMGTGESARARLAADGLWILAIVCALVVTIAVASPEIVLLITGPGYAGALPALGFSLLAVLGMALYLVASLPSSIARATHDLGLATGLSVVVAVVANIALVETFASVGTAAAVALGQFAAVVIVDRRGRHRVPLPVAWPTAAGLIVAAAIVVLVGLVGGAALPVRLALGCGAFLLIARTASLGRVAHGILGEVRGHLGRRRETRHV